MADFIAIIPARAASTRLPNKPLADIHGIPMVVRVAQQAQQSEATRVVVATDDLAVKNTCQEHGVDVLMTRADHPTGTDRLAEVVEILRLTDESIVVNVQGDEPLIPPSFIREVAATLEQHAYASIATAAVVIDDPQEINNPHAVKVVLNAQHKALYFSRSPIPYVRNTLASTTHYRHIGIYAYRASFLKQFSKLAPSPLERTESLEQLRALHYGYEIAVHVAKEAPPPGVDTPEDLEHVRNLFKAKS